MKLMIGVSVGELFDKISILEIKSQKIASREKLRNVHNELEHLLEVKEGLSYPPNLSGLYEQLKMTNERLWGIEDEIRQCEKNKEFGPAFIKLARSVYQENDRRCALKNEISILFQSEIREEKSYSEYSFS